MFASCADGRAAAGGSEVMRVDSGAEAYRRFLDGDNDALVEIIRDYKDVLIRFLLMDVRDLTVAEELMEDVFVRLYVKKPRFSGKSQFKTWLLGIARNVAHEHRCKTAKAAHAPLEDGLLVTDSAGRPEAVLFEKERQKTLFQLLDRLNPDRRQVLYLTYFEGLSNKETAGIMRRSVGSVEVLLHRARTALKEELMKEGFDDEILH